MVLQTPPSTVPGAGPKGTRPSAEPPATTRTPPQDATEQPGAPQRPRPGPTHGHPQIPPPLRAAMTHAQAAVQKLDASVKSGAPAKEQEQAAEDAVNSVAVLVALISKLQSEMSQSMSKVMDRSAKDQLNKALKQAEKEIKQAEADLKAAKETEKSAHSGGFLKLLGAIFAIAVVALSCVAACFVGPMAIGVGLLVAGAIMAGTQAGAEMIQGKHTGKAAEYQAESAQDKIDAEKIANDIAHDKYVLDRIMDSFRRLLDDVSNNASAIQNILQVKQQSDSKLAGGG